MEFDYFDKIKKTDIRYKIAILTTFLMGLISHGMGLFNKFSFHDDVGSQFGVGTTYRSGRWMLGVLGEIEKFVYGDGHYSLPTFNGLFAIALISISACLVINLLDIKKKETCAFVAGLMVSFPSITGIFGYMFTLHFYMIALLLGTCGAYFICKANKWYLYFFGIMLIVFSLAIYQAFLPTILTLILFYLIKTVLEETNVKLLLNKMTHVGISCITAFTTYLISVKLSLIYYKATLCTHRGLNTMGKISMYEYFSRAMEAYEEFFLPTCGTPYCMFPDRLLHLYRFAIIITLFVLSISIIKLIRSDKRKAIIFMLLLLLIPFVVNFIFVMAEKTQTVERMAYSQLLVFVFATWIVEKTTFTKKNIRRCLTILVTSMAIWVLICYARLDNMCYLKATYAQQESISYFTTLVTQIKQANGYSDTLPVAFVNAGNIVDASLKGRFSGLEKIRYLPYTGIKGYVNDYVWFDFIRQWIGFSPTIVDATTVDKDSRVIQMPHYPNEGSIKKIDNIIVVKF